MPATAAMPARRPLASAVASARSTSAPGVATIRTAATRYESTTGHGTEAGAGQIRRPVAWRLHSVQDRPVDDIDRRIISELGADGRLTMFELGERVGLSSSAAHRRVKALEERGVITGYRAVVDRAASGRSFEVYVQIMMRTTEPAAVTELEQALGEVDEVVACHRLFGEPDYLVLVAVADLAAYEQLWTEQLATLPNAARVSSLMTMKVVKR